MPKFMMAGILSFFLSLGMAGMASPSLALERGTPATLQAFPQREFTGRVFGMLEGAQSEILAAYYILAHDETGIGFLARLMEAAKKGRKVKLLVDGVGPGPVFPIPDATLSLLARSGVELGIYHPKLSMLFKVKQRLHDKLLIVDRGQVLLGSSNIWNESALGVLREKDVILSGSGPQVDASVRHFFAVWNSSEVFHPAVSSSPPHGEAGFQAPEATDEEVEQFIQAGKRKLGWSAVASDSITPAMHETNVLYVYDGAVNRPDSGVFAKLIEMIDASHETIDIKNPYPMFVDRLKQAIGRAIARGVKVRLISASAVDLGRELAPLRGAYLSQLPYFASAGIDVWEYQNSFLHEKTLVVDGRIAYLGSANLDSLSAYRNTENGIIVTREGPQSAFIESLVEDFAARLQGSLPVVKDGRILDSPGACEGLCATWKLVYPELSTELPKP